MALRALTAAHCWMIFASAQGAKSAPYFRQSGSLNPWPCTETSECMRVWWRTFERVKAIRGVRNQVVHVCVGQDMRAAWLEGVPSVECLSCMQQSEEAEAVAMQLKRTHQVNSGRRPSVTRLANGSLVASTWPGDLDQDKPSVTRLQQWPAATRAPPQCLDTVDSIRTPLWPAAEASSHSPFRS